MQVSIMENTKDNFVPKTVTDLNDLASIIKRHTYSLGLFDKNYRSNASFRGAKFIGLDFDGGLSLKHALAEFKDASCIIGTTRNHQKVKDGKPACDRFRVILELSETITTAEDLKATALALLQKYPQADKACSDAARMFFPCESIEYINKSAKTQRVFRYNKTVSDIKKGETLDKLVKGHLSKNTLNFIASGAPEGEWNSRLFKAAVDCMEQGYTQSETIEVLRKATLSYEGDLNEKDLSTIDSAFNREAKHPPRNVQNPFDFKKPNQLAAVGQKVNWLVDGLMIAGGTSILAGVPKSGKSTIARQLAVGIAKGQTFFDRPTKKGKVLYLAMEESAELIDEQFKRIGLNDSDDMLIHVGPIATGNILDNLKESIVNYGATLLVVDTLLLLARFSNINDYKETYEKMQQFSNIARATGCHILFLHHQKKGEDRGQDSISGSSALQGSVDMFMVLNNVKGRDQYRKLTSWQRGGTRFVNTELKYQSETDTYELSKSQDLDF